MKSFLKPWVAVMVLAFFIHALPARAATEIPVVAAATGVTVVEDDTSFTLSNGILTARVNKRNGDLSSLLYKGVETFAANSGHAGGYWSHDTTGGVETITKISINPKDTNGERAEVSVKGISGGRKMGHPAGSPPDGDFAADIEIRYSLGKDDSGVYTYCILDHKPEYPNATLGEARYCAKLADQFDWLLVDDLRHLFYPPEKEAQGDNKYNYTTGQFDHPAFGWASADKQVGCFIVNPTTEYLSGGPTKVEFVCHRDTARPYYAPCILNYWRSSHYGGSSVDVAQGEAWTKVVGPFLIYCNSGGDPVSLWKDAVAQQTKENAKWPYDWVNGVDFPHKAERATVSGQLVLNDPLMAGAKMSNVRVGLTHPDYHVTTNRAPAGNTPADITWMTDAKHYEFWARGADDGKFAVTNVRAGKYTLHAIADGVLGEFAKAEVTVEAGKPLDLGKLNWTPVRHGKQVWDIGIPNRNSSEYVKGNDFFHDGMGLVYRDMFPNDVNYVIGKSDFRKDWYFEHVSHVEDPNARPNSIVGGGAATGRASPWTISWDMANAPKGMATLRVAIAGGSVGGNRIPVAVNGQAVEAVRIAGDSTVGRNGIQGLWYEREIAIPATMLKAGTNTLTLTVPAGGQTNGVVYDYLRLELDESAQPPAP